MKLKKLLAAVVSGALALSTMAISSFSVSAAAVSDTPAGIEKVISTFTTGGNPYSESFTSTWGNGQWVDSGLSADDLTSYLNDSSVYIKLNASGVGSYVNDKNESTDFDTMMGWGWVNYNWVTMVKLYRDKDTTNPVTFVPIPSSKADKAVCYAPLSDIAGTNMIDENGLFQCNVQSGHFSALTVDSIQIVQFSTDTTVYSEQEITPLPEFANNLMKFDGTFNSANIGGMDAGIEITYTGAEDGNVIKLIDGTATETNWDGFIGKGVTNGSGSVFFKFSAMSSVPSTIWINTWKIGGITSVKIKNNSSSAPVYEAASTPDPVQPLAFDKSEVTVNLSDKSYHITVTDDNYEGIEWTSSDETIATVVNSDVTFVKAGTVTITAKRGEETATCKVTIVDDSKPDDPKPDDPKPDDPKPDDPHTHTAGTEWKTDASNHWHVCTGCDEVMDKAAHTFDGGTITTPATETATGVMTYKCTACGFIKTETIPAKGVPVIDPDYHPVYTGPVVIPANSPINSGKPSTSDGKAGWNAISEQLTTTGESAVKVDMNGETRLPKAIVSDISGKDVDLVLNMGRGITWTINGLSVTTPGMVDLSVSMNARTDIPDEAIDAIEGFGKKTISLDHNGSFGFTATMTISIGTRRNGYYANMFYYNPKTKELEFMDSDLIEGGKADIVFNHASDYLLVLSEEPLGEYEDVSSAAGVTASDDVIASETSSAAYVILLAAAAVAGGFVVYKKRARN